MPGSQAKVYKIDDPSDIHSAALSPQTVAPVALERLRLTGTRDIQPDTSTRTEMIGAGRLSVLATIKLCVNARGRVISATLQKASGFPTYDQKIVREAGRWTFRPYLIARNPVDVCSGVSFFVVPDPTMLNP